MSPRRNAAFLIIPWMFFPACQQSKDTTDPGKVSYESIAADRYGKNVEFIPNADSSFMLCVKREESPGQPVVLLRFLVYDVSRQQVLYEDSLDQAAVFWMDASQIRVVSTPEVTSGDETPGGGYIYDVRGRKRRE